MKENLTQTLEQRLQQRLSPLQMRLVRMLELSEPEVEEEVKRELDENPALEQTDAVSTEGNDFSETADELQRADFKDEDDAMPVYRTGTNSEQDYTEPLAVADPPSMMDVLSERLAETDISDEDMSVAVYILGNLDDNGYLTRSLDDISDDLAFTAGVDVNRERLEEIFERIRSLDPPGIGALDLRDCLLLQLDRMKQTEAVKTATRIVSDYFDLFTLRHYSRIEGLAGISHEQMTEAQEIIKSLNPKPGNVFEESRADEKSRHITPDFLVEVEPDGRFTITIPNNLPDLTVEESFKADSTVFADGNASSPSAIEAAGFISRRRRQAEEFIELLKMRQDTLMRVAKAIVAHQKDFFMTEEESDIRPMTLRDIASAAGLDVSVVSRATSTKYLATARGVYPLRYFFSSGISHSGDGGDGESVVSAKNVTAALKELIEGENPDAPLTDDELCRLLNERGYGLKRRTVAKYRDRLGIPVARLRKKV